MLALITKVDSVFIPYCSFVLTQPKTRIYILLSRPLDVVVNLSVCLKSLRLKLIN